jgi:hypothetical protein
MRRLLIGLVLMPLLCKDAYAQSAIGLFSDTAGASCEFRAVELFVPFHIYVLAHTTIRVTGAAYSIVGMPGQWGNDYVAQLIYAPNSYNSIGHAFDGYGQIVTLAPSMLPDQNGNVLLATYWVVVINPSLPVSATLRVHQATPSPVADYQCPFLSDLSFNLFCVSGGEAYLNSPGSCTVAVSSTTWTEVRSLYR